MSEKKNPDYTESAVSLTNSPELRDMLMVRKERKVFADELEEVLHETREWKAVQQVMADANELDGRIKETIDRLGGFQDIDDGLYALRQRRLSLTYIPKLVRTILPKFAEALIEEVVNKEAMGGLLKGRLVSEEQSEACAERTENLAYIIKT